MKKFYFTLRVLAFVYCVSLSNRTSAQCLAGYTSSQLNWDYLDFLPSADADYTAWYTSATRPYSQTFTMGTRRLNFTMSPTANITLDGENYTNTADAGSFATQGSDVQFTTTNTANTTVTMTLDSNVMNVRFSLFDLDNNQRVIITAKNLAGASQLITVVKANAGSTIAILNSGTNTVTATGPGSNYTDNDNRSAINVTVVGPVASITLTFSNATGDFWLGDINACVTGSFPVSYRNVSRPFTGQPSYILTVRDNEFYMLDPATGRAKTLFTDPGHTNMNGMAYDPYERILYYTYSLTGTPSTTKTIYKYDVDSETIGTLFANVNAAPLNIPTYDPGVTSGSASFYNGSLYFGVESGRTGGGSANQTGRENTVWKIDFDASQNPIRASQVYATKVDSNIAGNDRLIHDWSDIGVTNNGMMYDFDGAGAGTSNLDSMYYHFNMMTGQRLQFPPSGAGNIGPKQVAIDWNENVYNMGGLPTRSSNAQNIGGFIVPYLYNGTVNNAQNKLVFENPGPVFSTGSWGDCSEAFRPLCDFGDAPASYDPNPLSPAVNERDSALRIGGTFDREWNKTSSALADADGADEDGVSTVTIFNPNLTTYQVQVSVYNHMLANARLIGWLDYNGNGLFDAGEASATVVVPSSTSVQNPWLSWTGISSSLANGSFTYLRIRITTSAMVAANATGWFDNGETEDYRVSVSTVILPVTLLSFDAKAINNSKVQLDWSASEEVNLYGYEVQRSRNGSSWEYVNFISASQSGGIEQYQLTDNDPYKGTSSYRLKIKEADGRNKYSEIRNVKINDLLSSIIVSPNPANNVASVKILNGVLGQTANITVIDLRGAEVYYRKIKLVSGDNIHELPVQSWPSGTYSILVSINEGIISKKLIIRR
jgi:hypothetical protein